MNIDVRIHVQRGLKGLILGLGVVLVTGCGGDGIRIYQPNPPSQVGQPMPLKIAVVELEDFSPGTGFNNFLILPPPLYLYWTEYQKYHRTLFGKCVAAELKASHLFDIVDYHPHWEGVAQGFRSYDIVVTGRLLQDRFERAIYSYGLSSMSGALWIVGFPVEGSSREAKFELIAVKSLEPNRPVWTHSIAFEDSKVRGFFYGHGASDDMMNVHVLTKGSVGVSLPETDFCPSGLLQPLFFAMRNSLAGTLKQNIAGQGNAPHAEAKSGERKAP